MQALASTSSPPTLAGELQALHGQWGWFLALGVVMVAAGTFAVSWSCLATITIMVTWLFGILLLAAGFLEIVSSFSAARWRGTLLHILVGVLYAVAGFVLVEHPGRGAVELTLIIAIFLMIGGVFRIVSALVERFTGWGWVFLNGVVSLLLGLMIYKQWPASGLWVIGLFVGIEMIFNGWVWIMLALGLRNVPKAATASA
jgi:uncharacterized membrane protein HdeD (DUF308 family)